MSSHSEDVSSSWKKSLENFASEQRTFQFDWEVLLDSALTLPTGNTISALFSRVYVGDKDLVKLGLEEDAVNEVTEKLNNISVNLNYQKYIYNIEKLGLVSGFDVLPMRGKVCGMTGHMANRPVFDESSYSDVKFTPYQSLYATSHNASCNFRPICYQTPEFEKSLLPAARSQSNDTLSDENDTSAKSEGHSTSSSLESICSVENQLVDPNFDFGFDAKRDAKLVAKNGNKFLKADKEVMKYWFQRYRLFSKLDEGALMDREGWFSVTPERIAEHIAERIVHTRGMVILDAFTGVGGNAIQFARLGAHVIALDLDPVKIRCAAQNARIYGVADQIQFVCTNFFHFAKSFQKNIRNLLAMNSGGDNNDSLEEKFSGVDAVFLSPPWGGPAYLKEKEFDLERHLELDGYEIFRVASEISPNICYFLPRNTSVKQLISLAETTGKVEIEQNCLNGKVKTICAYYGNLIAG